MNKNVTEAITSQIKPKQDVTYTQSEATEIIKLLGAAALVQGITLAEAKAQHKLQLVAEIKALKAQRKKLQQQRGNR